MLSLQKYIMLGKLHILISLHVIGFTILEIHQCIAIHYIIYRYLYFKSTLITCENDFVLLRHFHRTCMNIIELSCAVNVLMVSELKWYDMVIVLSVL